MIMGVLGGLIAGAFVHLWRTLNRASASRPGALPGITPAQGVAAARQNMILGATSHTPHDPMSGIPTSIPLPVPAHADPATEDKCWERALKEVQDDMQLPALWAKSLSQANGNEKQAAAIYMRQRVAQWLEEDRADREGNAKRIAAIVVLAAEDVKKLASGAAPDKETLSMIVSVIEYRLDWLKVRDPVRGNSLLHHAAKLGARAEIEKMLALGADPSLRNGNGARPADLAQSADLKRLLQVRPH